MIKTFFLFSCLISVATDCAMHTGSYTLPIRKELRQVQRVETKKANHDAVEFARLLQKKEPRAVQYDSFEVPQLIHPVLQKTVPLDHHLYAHHALRMSTVATIFLVAGLLTPIAQADTLDSNVSCLAQNASMHYNCHACAEPCMHADEQIYCPASSSAIPAVESLWKSQLYAPWRASYNKKLKGPARTNACPFCSQLAKNNDEQEFILKRTDHFMVALNLYPYSPGHLLIIPLTHIKNLEELNGQARKELVDLQIECIKTLSTVLKTEDFNVGINIGKNAGASIPDHLHVHIVPRYEHERLAFMHTIAQTNTFSIDLKDLYAKLKNVFR